MINITLTKERAKQLAIFLGVQYKEDTLHILEKYNLDINEYDMEDSLQELFEKLRDELELEM